MEKKEEIQGFAAHLSPEFLDSQGQGLELL